MNKGGTRAALVFVPRPTRRCASYCLVAWPTKPAPGQRASMPSLRNDSRAIDPNVANARRKLMWVVEGCAVTNRAWIEDHHIRFHARPDHAAIVKGKPIGNGFARTWLKGVGRACGRYSFPVGWA